VILTWDPATAGFWLVQDYFPEIAEVDQRIFPPLEEFRRALGRVEVHPLPVPHNCHDGFLGAYWQRPQAYLDHDIRSGMSTFSKIHDGDRGLARLRGDLEDGTWERRYGHLLGQSDLDLGYRLVVADRGSVGAT